MTDYVVERASAALPSGEFGYDDLFEVTGGRVVIKRLIGLTTTSVTADGSGFYLWVSGPVAGQALGSGISLNGTPAGYGVSAEGASWAPSGALDVVLLDGYTVQALVSGDSTISGSVAWTLVYEPLDPGAKVEAA